MKLDRLRESNVALDTLAKRLQTARANVSSDYYPHVEKLITRLESSVQELARGCKRAEKVVQVGDENNNVRRTQLVLMKMKLKLDRSEVMIDKEMRFMKNGDDEHVKAAGESLKTIEKHLLSYQKRLKEITQDVSGEEETQDLRKLAESTMKTVTEILNDIDNLPEPDKSVAQTASEIARKSREEASKATQAVGKMLGGIMPDVVTQLAKDVASSDFAKEAARVVTSAASSAAAIVPVKEDIRDVLKDVCGELNKNCAKQILPSETGKSKLEDYRAKELKSTGELLAKINPAEKQKSEALQSPAQKRPASRLSPDNRKARKFDKADIPPPLPPKKFDKSRPPPIPPRKKKVDSVADKAEDPKRSGPK